MHTLDALWQTIQARRDADPDESWTAKLIARGPEKCAEKFGEEAIETVIEAVRGDRARLAEEGADLLYHFCVMLAAADVDLAEVMARLEARTGRSGITEKASRAD
ncbi:phosphoribosyl-ATP diphosphatase [Jannaschia ovalis]|uniref:Phosphoribosyl-ATP pyrophosphatase n=1 Tax=Jannaschia ovalis TaxID=3038773 RepID=A0ABY8L9G7_9RHOB|nr:phosphoribosyl-ATP diphosphatase [Jannaschia sp. GRR-S6-38]WGH77946.1 phosphoribosyl-ATP diphosphatase [Jannaschia sp. GRR-S6-38]